MRKAKTMAIIAVMLWVLAMPMTVLAAKSPHTDPPDPPPTPPTPPGTPVVIVPAVSPKTFDAGFTMMNIMIGAGGVTAVIAAKKARE